ncbi:MAG: hypothetical protein ACOYYS_00905 [Chloroflexota bacterium]
MATPIDFNGKTYFSLEEMPPDVRQAYQQVTAIFSDQNQNGIPDTLEGTAAGTAKRAPYVLADDDHNGIPDIFETAGKENRFPGTASAAGRKAGDLPPQTATPKAGADQDDLPDWLKSTHRPLSERRRPAKAAPARLDRPVAPLPPASAVVEPEGADFRLVMVGCATVVLIAIGAGAVLLWGLR